MMDEHQTFLGVSWAPSWGVLFVFLFWLFLLLPFADAEAYTHTFTCSDAHFVSGASCSGDVFTVPSNGYYGFDSFLPSPTGTWYMTGTWTATGGAQMCAQASGVITDFVSSGSYTNQTVTMHGDTSLVLDNRSAVSSGCTGNTSSNTYVFSGLCLSDDPTGCGGAAPTEPWPDGSEVFRGIGTSSSSTIQYSIVDNPVQDLFEGVSLFITGAWMMLWLFKRRN